MLTYNDYNNYNDTTWGCDHLSLDELKSGKQQLPYYGHLLI